VLLDRPRRIFYGVAYGMVLYVISVGLSITMGMMGIANLAHGVFAMCGGYILVTALAKYQIPFPIALALSFLIVAFFSIFLDRLLYKHIYDAPELEQVLFSIALIFISIAIARLIFGTLQQPVMLPDYLKDQFTFLGRDFPAYRVFIIIFSAILIAALWFGVENTKWGAMVRATVDNRAMAQSIGINTKLLFSITFAVGSGLAGMGGALGAEIIAIQCNPAWKKGTVVAREVADLAPGQASQSSSATTLQMDTRVVEALRENLRAGNQSIVLVNRRGYAYYLYSVAQRTAVQCPNCSISLTVHGRTARLRCHYCDYATTVAAVMKKSPEDTFVTVGYGSERAEEALQAVLPEARIMRLDSDTVSDRDLLPATLAKFRNREVDILVGTQILAKGHDFPSVTLVVIIEVDQTLSLPDFRAGERTFQLIVQAAGRAGRAGLPGRVMIQSARFSHPVVQLALAQDYKTFVVRELEFRKAYGYPPFSRMISLEFSSSEQRKVEQAVQKIDFWIDAASTQNPDLFSRVKVLGPATPPLETVRGRHRRTVLLASYHPESVRELLTGLVGATADLGADVRVRIDVDPQSLM
ncbi:MAG: primosomal protein N', partial [Proteobacteria bacterium]|nr:primosomal protein N' [Pseudomonadota bacterium]